MLQWVSLLGIFGIGSYLIFKKIKKNNLLYFASLILKEKKGVDFKIENNSFISFKFKNDKVVVPFSNEKVESMFFLKVTGFKGETKFDLTQYSGIPYLFSSNDLDLDFIIIENTETGEFLKYQNDEIIGFCEKLWNTEF